MGCFLKAVEKLVAVDRLMVGLGLKPITDEDGVDEKCQSFGIMAPVSSGPFAVRWWICGDRGEWDFALILEFSEVKEIQYIYDVSTDRWSRSIENLSKTKAALVKASENDEPLETRLQIIVDNAEHIDIDSDEEAYALIVDTVKKFLTLAEEHEKGQPSP